jgi:hypothetical protein
MNLKEISKTQLTAAIKKIDELKAAGSIEGGEAGDLKAFFRELAAGETEGALITYSRAFDTITRETALKILNRI